jgi:hypothetical protein
MNLVEKAAAALGLGFVAGTLPLPASALLLTYDDIVTGATPASVAPWLTAEITNNKSGVSMTLDVGASSPEFLTDIYFSLASTANLSQLADPTTSPDITLSTCNSKSSSPANTGPWQLCLGFAPKLQVSDPTKITFDLLGIFERDFVANSAGWFSVAHLQGIQPNCSAWVGSGNSTATPSGGGSCTSVPEPGTLSLMSFAVAAVLGSAAVRRRRLSVQA